ncbi:MAG: pirin family protein [Leptospirales bacterium]|jgi:redox-sensitive bicupin YhaK (pirin superfamily)|nr:pirin family protein [Leptospirales bacterium]HMU84980.1 pirin family protein [Leptospiraceae bacterium]HNE25419.1 pirin family protein [Leptospiraceae bacterium]HNJ03335.1 pirin family protein [Leptospiraceae bacterium]HNJ34550.1 pirin family protein [Leptospiraceae bacterium]
MSQNGKVRTIARIIDSIRQREGGGFIVRRPFPTQSVSYVDPFLLLDEMGPADYAPGEAVGAPDHPHRGFETVTYMLEGEFQHEDSAGHRGFLRPGDVQWMTAGAGIIHSEEPSEKIMREGGRVHGFQIWVNLPSQLKMTQPRYQEVPGSGIPTAQTEDGLARVRVIAGEALGVRAVIETHIPIVYQDWTLSPGASASVIVPQEQNAMIYVFEGSVAVGDRQNVLEDGQLGVLGLGDTVQLFGTQTGGRMLLLAGVPTSEPVARYGPFVMNTVEELQTAFNDYQSGKMGEITRGAKYG